MQTEFVQREFGHVMFTCKTTQAIYLQQAANVMIKSYRTAAQWTLVQNCFANCGSNFVNIPAFTHVCMNNTSSCLQKM